MNNVNAAICIAQKQQHRKMLRKKDREFHCIVISPEIEGSSLVSIIMSLRATTIFAVMSHKTGDWQLERYLLFSLLMFKTELIYFLCVSWF